MDDMKHTNLPASLCPVCRIYMDNLGLDGEISSKVFPLADTARRDYPIEDPVDCTWEMLAERGQRVGEWREMDDARWRLFSINFIIEKA